LRKGEDFGDLKELVREGAKLLEVWVDGQDVNEIKAKLKQVEADREELEKKKKQLNAKRSAALREMSKNDSLEDPMNDPNGNESNSNPEQLLQQQKTRYAFQITMLNRVPFILVHSVMLSRMKRIYRKNWIGLRAKRLCTFNV
jgi:septal ring factor EnvC (AmiA/AmiB activator)